jgi:carboxylesterase
MSDPHAIDDEPIGAGRFRSTHVRVSRGPRGNRNEHPMSVPISESTTGNTTSALPTLILIHGLFSSPLEFSLLSRILQSRGVSFDCLEVAGYTNPGERYGPTWQHWLAAAGAALDAKYGPDQPIVLGGVCVGGAIAAALAAQPRRQSIVGVAMLAPTFAYDSWAIGGIQRYRRLAYALGFDRWLKVREKEPFGIKNEKTRTWIQQELANNKSSAVGPAALPLRGIRETERLYAHVKTLLAGISAPLLVLHALEDEIATLASVERVLATTQPAKVKLVVLEHSYHMITLDNDRQRVAHELADFVGAEKLLRPAPPTSAKSRRTATAR